MKNLIIKSVFLAFLLLTFDQEAHCAISHPLTLKNYVEAVLGGARGILACTSHFHKNSDSSNAKKIHSATKATRLMHEILTIINHPGEANYAPAFWAVFNASDLCFDFFKENDSALDEESVSFSQEQAEKIQKIAEAVQRYLLPFFESGTAVYSALNNGQTPQDLLMRRRMRALCSLSQSLSLYMDHQNSKTALLLLLASCSEVALSLNAQPKLSGRPQLERQPEQSSQQNNSNLNGDFLVRNNVLNRLDETPDLTQTEQQATDSHVQTLVKQKKVYFMNPNTTLASNLGNQTVQQNQSPITNARPLQKNSAPPAEQITEAEQRHRANLRRHNYLRHHGSGMNSEAEQDTLWQQIQEYENSRPYEW